jgi:hypothetical protein
VEFKNINSALTKPIVDNSNFSIDWAFNNFNFEPSHGQPFGESFILPNQPSQSSLGANGTDLINGIFQINLNYPDGDGSGPIYDKIQEISAIYKSGTTLTYNGVVVRLESIGISPARNERGWYRIDLNIEWYSFTNRS